eukprot:NODE_594_length_5604_cov_0.154950.p4 type:complete len:274 gc:universal NODE_594_length_5604_cov_0.154950:2464-1643(-)
MVFIAVVRATQLPSGDRFGKGDPYIELKYGQESQKTKKSSGSDPSWDNAHFNMDGNHNMLYVLHKDADKGGDSVMTACAIDLNQMPDVANGWFKLFNVKGEQQGRVLLNIGKQGRPNGLPNEQEYSSQFDEELKQLVHKINKSANMKDGLLGAGAVLGGIGAGFLGKKAYEHFNPQEKQEMEQKQQEQQQQQQGETEEQRRQREEQQQQQQHHQGGAQQGSTGGEAGNWDGNFKQYQTGQIIDYNGQKYRVLQSHASQSDWAPSVAHSLFQQI